MADKAQPTLSFEVKVGPATIRQDYKEQRVTIGKGDDAMLKVEANGIGDLHCVVNVEDDGSVLLLDLGTENGTQFRGNKISNVKLEPGDTFQLGEVVITIQFEAAASDQPMAVPFDEDHPTVPDEEATVLASEPVADIIAKAQEEAAAKAAAETIGDLPAVPEASSEVATEVTAQPMSPNDLPAEDDSTDETGEESPLDATEDVVGFVMRSGTAQSNLGINPKKPKVLEVNQMWGDMLLDTKHFVNKPGNVSIGSSVGYRWQFLGVDMGWIPRPLSMVLPYTPPMWSEVVSDWKNDFYSPDMRLPKGTDHDLFVFKDDNYVAEVMSDWDGFVDVGEKRYTFDELVEAGKASKSADTYEIPVTDEVRLMVDVDGVVFFAHKVKAGQKLITRSSDEVDYPFLAIGSFIGFLGVMFALVMYFSPRPPENDLIDIPDRFVDLLIDKEEEKKKEKKPARDPDAGEGEKAKKEEGKVGKKDAKKMKAKGNKVDMKERDKKIAESAGIFSEEGLDMGGANLDPDLAGAIGGAIGAKGVQFGSGGLGSRGGGFGGGGTAEGLGGMGTKGMGAGRSGYGKGGGDMGPKGEGGIGTVGGDPIIVGSLDRSLIDAVIKRHMNQIRYCYQRELTKNPNLAGKVGIKFVIAKDGSVSKANPYEDTMTNPAVSSCIVGRFMRMTFPKPKGGGIVIVKYPFLFSPG
jgi:hypothetical protein